MKMSPSLDPTIGNAKTGKKIVETFWSVFFLKVDLFWSIPLYRAGFLH